MMKQEFTSTTAESSVLNVEIKEKMRGWLVVVNGDHDLFFYNREMAERRREDILATCKCMADVERSRECSNSMTGGQCF